MRGKGWGETTGQTSGVGRRAGLISLPPSPFLPFLTLRNRGPAGGGHLWAGVQPMEEQGVRLPQLQPQHRRLPLRPPPGEVPGDGAQQQPNRQPQVRPPTPPLQPPNPRGKLRHRQGVWLRWELRVVSIPHCAGDGSGKRALRSPNPSTAHLFSAHPPHPSVPPGTTTRFSLRCLLPICIQRRNFCCCPAGWKQRLEGGGGGWRGDNGDLMPPTPLPWAGLRAATT